MDKKLLGRKIRELRESKGITQVELASNAQVSRSMLRMIEEGLQNSSIDTLNRIAEALDTKLTIEFNSGK